jgi:hypothetical protein
MRIACVQLRARDIDEADLALEEALESTDARPLTRIWSSCPRPRIPATSCTRASASGATAMSEPSSPW